MKQLQARWVGVGVLSLGLIAASLMPVFAQDGDRGQRGERGDRERRQGRQVDREAMQQRMHERLRQSLQMSEEEFSVVAPMIEQVQGYRREQQMAGARRGRGGWGRGGGELSDEGQAVHDAAQELREAIVSESISTEQIEQRLNALREARSQLDATLDEARNELRQVLTLRQEALLVAQGVLD